MIERTAPLAFCQPQEAESAMGVIVPWLKRARATETSYGFP